MSKKDQSKKIPQRDKIAFELKINQPFELTEKQKKIITASMDKNTRCVFIDGLYGSSKTWCAVYAALQLLNTKRVSEIVYIRNPVEASSTGKVGFLKGDLAEKMAPYNAVLFEKLEEFLSDGDIEKLKVDERVNCLPLGHIRGRSWNCKAVIVDEASSMSFDDLMLILTRCGEFTRVFLVGDSKNQNDIGSKEGFTKMFNLFSDEESVEQGIHTFELKDKSDILRSGFVRYILEKTGKIS